MEAKKLEPVQVEEVERERLPDMGLLLKGNGRVLAVAKFRELADKLESGELDGARVQWRASHPEEELEGKPTEMQTVTVTQAGNGRRGTVQLLTYTIEEE